MPAPDMPRGMTFAEFVTTLATALTIINVYNTASVSSPGPGSSRRFSMRSASAQRRIRRRTVTSSTRLYLTMAVPYVAATVLVNRIPAEEVCPIYIAAVASVSGRFNKGRHTVLEWTFKALRTFTILFIMALFMLFQGLGDEPMISINEVHDIRMRPLHVLFSMFSSYRWFVILALGLVSVSPLQPRINVLLAALKIGLIWFILEGSGNVHAPGAWGVFDAVIITSTPLRNTVFILYSFLIFSDAAESVAFSILNQKNPLRSPSSSTPSASESDEGAFGTLQILRTPENDGLYTFEEYIKYSRDFTASVYSTIVNGRRKKKHDEEDKSYPGDEFDIEQGLPRRPG